MKKYAKLTGGQGVEYLNVQVAGTCIYRCKLSANGSDCNVSVWYFHSSHRGAALSGQLAATAPVAVLASRSFSFNSTDGTCVVWQYGVRLISSASSRENYGRQEHKDFYGVRQK
jgi:hypothetical protein